MNPETGTMEVLLVIFQELPVNLMVDSVLMVQKMRSFCPKLSTLTGVPRLRFQCGLIVPVIYRII